MTKTLSSIILDATAAHLRGKRIAVGNDRTFREVANVERKSKRWKITFTDGEVRYPLQTAKIRTPEEGGGLPPSR